MPDAAELSTEELQAIAGGPSLADVSTDTLRAVASAPPPVTTAPSVPYGPAPSLAQELDAASAREIAKFGPETFPSMGRAMLPMVLPPVRAAGWLGYGAAGALGGGYATFDRTVGKLSQKRLDEFTADDYRDLGTAALWGAGTGMAMHGVANLIFGRPAPARREADAALTVPGAGAFGRPQPPPIPVTPADKAALGQRVEDLITPGIPATTAPHVTAAYDAFRAETIGRPIDVTAYNRTLRTFAEQHFPDAGLPRPEALFRPIGTPTRVTIPGQGQVTRWYATADELLARENGVAFTTQQRNAGGGPTFPGGLMRRLRNELGGALQRALTPEESAALTAARDLSRMQHEAINARDLLNSTRTAEGVINPSGLAKRLVDDPERYRLELGNGLYEQMVTLAQAGDTLKRLPNGREAFAQIVARSVGALGGYLLGQAGAESAGIAGGYGSYPGAITGAIAGPRLLGPTLMTWVERLARAGDDTRALPELVGRLAVAMSMEDAPAPDAAPTTPQPLPLPAPTPTPLGRMGAP